MILVLNWFTEPIDSLKKRLILAILTNVSLLPVRLLYQSVGQFQGLFSELSHKFGFGSENS